MMLIILKSDRRLYYFHYKCDMDITNHFHMNFSEHWLDVNASKLIFLSEQMALQQSY